MAGNPTPTPAPQATPPADPPASATPAPAGGPGSGTPAEAPKPEDPQVPPEDPTSPEWLKKRLDRADRKGQEKILKDLGVDNLEDAKAKLAKLAELEKASLTETERLQKERDDALKLAKENEKRLQELEQASAAQEHKNQLESAVRSAGIKQDAIEFAVFKLEQHIAADPVLSAMDVRDPVVYKAFFDALKTSSPHLFDTASAPPANSGPNNPPGPTPPASGTPAANKNVLDMSPKEYAEYAKTKFGISTTGLMR